MNLTIQKVDPNKTGQVSLMGMTNNLMLNGASNYIGVEAGGLLSISQPAAGGGAPNTNGIGLGAAHSTTTAAVKVSGGGKFLASGKGEVKVAGMVENHGGKVEVDTHTTLSINASISAGQSYLQDGAAGSLTVNRLGKLAAAGHILIDGGKLDLVSTNPGGWVSLVSAGVFFSNTNNTFFNVVKWVPITPGNVRVQGDFTLGTKTLTTMNYNTADGGTADLLTVIDGIFIAMGKLELVGNAAPNAGTNFIFFECSGENPHIAWGFDTITDNFGGTPTDSVLTPNANTKQLKITWQMMLNGRRGSAASLPILVRAQRATMLKLLFHLLMSFQPFSDFVGRREAPLKEYVTPEQKVDALLRLANGDPKPYDAILKKIKARGEHAKRRTDDSAKRVTEVEQVLQMEWREARPDLSSIRGWEIALDSSKTMTFAWMRTYKSKLKEEASLEACRKFIEAMRTEMAKREKKR